MAEDRTQDIKWLKLYTIKEIASVMGVSESTVRKYIKSGELEAKLIAGKYRITEIGLRRFMGEEM